MRASFPRRSHELSSASYAPGVVVAGQPDGEGDVWGSAGRPSSKRLAGNSQGDNDSAPTWFAISSPKLEQHQDCCSVAAQNDGDDDDRYSVARLDKEKRKKKKKAVSVLVCAATAVTPTCYAKLAARVMGAASVQLSSALHTCTYTQRCELLFEEKAPSSPLSAPPWPVFPLILGFKRKPYAPLYWRRRCSR